MRGLMTAVIGMGILIAVGATVLVVLLVQRMSSAATPNASAVIAAPAMSQAESALVLDEPVGTHIASVSLTGERLAVQLAGGGPDRVVIVDTRSGRVAARTALAR
ncbi:MAG: hypothetical protein M3N26_01665 [Pseudomonadota bacterium]|nr:hypothetical protein [Pseudomonadota bacterium]